MSQTAVPSASEDSASGEPGESSAGEGSVGQAEAIGRATALSAIEIAAELRPDLATLINRYFRHVSEEDLPTRPDDVIAVVEAHRRLGSVRMPGEPLIRVYNPTVAGDAWSDSSTVVDLVNDDMPYLVDSVIAAFATAGLVVHRVLHPILTVRRDPSGALQEVLPANVGHIRRGDGSAASRERGVIRESWVHLLIDRLTDAERAENFAERLATVLADVRQINEDTADLTATAVDVAEELRRATSHLPAAEIIECADLLEWLADGHLTFLGYGLYEFDAAGGSVQVPGSGLGLLREERARAGHYSVGIGGADPERASALLDLTQASVTAVVAKNTYPFHVSVRIFGEDGRVTAEHRFIGMLTPRARNAEVTGTPVLRRLVEDVLTALGSTPDSYTGQRVIDLLATYPRAELFWADTDDIVGLVRGVLQLTSSRQLRIFLQKDPYRRFVSALVFLPRDRYTTAARLAIQQVLVTELGGSDIRYTARVGDASLAVVHFTVTTDPSHSVEIDLPNLTEAVRATIRTWEDELVAAVQGDEDVLDSAGERSRYGESFDEAYKEDYRPADAVLDLQRLDALGGPEDFDLSMLIPPEGRAGNRRLKIYVTGVTITLSRVLPLFQSLGAEVIDEIPYQVTRTDGTPSRIYDFGLKFPEAYLGTEQNLHEVRARFTDAFVAGWRGDSEVDGFNSLVLSTEMDWHQVAVVRAYAHYLRQIGTPYTQGYLESVLTQNSGIAGALAELFAIRFDPERFADEDFAGRQAAADVLVASITADLDLVTSLDADRILRSFLRLILATVRTNAYVRDGEGRLRSFMSFKLNPREIPELPKPVPAHEIWVYSPRVEGVHLRFGLVARGGLRWSDRPEDFRTEILGLVKAQEVKNAVIVPVGAKGGFVVKQPPAATGDAAADREAFAAEGIACYKMFIQGLLDITDNRVGSDVVKPAQVVRHDGDDPYLVVAADKGTAKFSDTANGVAAENGFWLDDAFASGGSAGYDHKGMGITARGAWESVKHHFRELGINTQTQDFTVVGIGDMSGDVFGNGMLLSEHIKLVVAFDHRHIFIDPNPDPALSYVERRRLFDLPRSSWADYDSDLISAGGGVYPRTAKSVPITEEARTVLGLGPEVTKLSPADLMHAALQAPVDLLWNGGVGTYIKSSTETNAQVGDKANDQLRVDGNQVRARVVGEGGNLGVTQLGRIEFARNGGRINTDAIDNSAGVDTSDHEVNIKIALQPLIASGELSIEDRNTFLASMTDEVARLVLADNTAQNRVLGASRQHAAPMLSVHARLIDDLCAQGLLDRTLEYLPTPNLIGQRTAAGEGLCSPELSVLLAYVKAALSKQMAASDLPDSPAYASRLPEYFPTQMRELYPEAIAHHPLRREIVTTMTVNEVVNGAGVSFVFRLGEEMAASAIDAIAAYSVTTAVFDLDDLWADIAAGDNEFPAQVQDQLVLDSRRLLDRAARWFLVRRPQPLDVTAEITRYRAAVAELTPRMPRLLHEIEHNNVRADVHRLTEMGAPADLANRVGYLLYTFSLLDIIDVADAADRSVLETADLYYALSAHLGLDRMLSLVTALDRGDRWHSLARQAVRDDLYRSVRAICADVLAHSEEGQTPEEKIASWEQDNRSRLARARTTLGEIAGAGAKDLAALSVAAREIRSMIR
ncbi:NAD-glutamate dehydrogenase [Nakamurella silvestris]|nr:NAD-glutamate dehydrogenase [Nakamurella silvestris]